METIIQKTLKRLLDEFGADYLCVTIAEDNGHYRANIETDKAAQLIGRNGKTLSSLQVLLKNILWAQNDEKIFVTIDVDGYRKEQEDKIISRVEKTIELMRERNLSEMKLHPMTPYFRRVIHTWISTNFPELTTESVGEGTGRAIKVLYR
jgi:spoIIIJ-associated protein